MVTPVSGRANSQKDDSAAVALARVGSAELVARIATIAGNGMNCGAVKIAPLLAVLTIVPTVVFPPGTFCTLQLTAIFAAFDTVAVSVVDLPSNTDGLSAASATETFDGDASVVVEDDPAAPPHPETPRPTIVVAKYPATIAFCLQFVVLAFRFSQDIPRDKSTDDAMISSSIHIDKKWNFCLSEFL